ncbi:hypothetical protein Moror_1160 [Moniliophthora roreri MCA 2997]|uniref:DUF6533 domain-containing protein n=1 Tax=Moniliophthora roreri (strain MCA 2997) TaxID=1381753 RepID=V2XEY2_MONRO|nr:hypothetical protein Moror_1160 [Moniliophthora roreri MCA 2997]
MNAQLVASCLGLTLTTCDIYLTRKEEKALIWSSPFHFTIVKTLFIFSRYFGLASQLYNVSLSAYWRYRYTAATVPRRFCTRDLAFKIFEHYFLLTILYIVLMLRVYALYNKSLAIILFLVLILALLQFNYICFPTESTNMKPGLVVLILAEALFQIIIHALVSKKTWTLPSTWSRTPTLTSVVTRDGFYVFLAIFVGIMAVIASSHERRLALLFLHPLFVFVIPCACCRVIMRLHRFRNEEASACSQGQDPVFSTLFSVWEVQTFPRNSSEA